MPVGKDEIRNRWGYHPPADPINVKRHEQIREAYIAFAEFLDMLLPDGRAKSSAFTHLQQSSMWANFAIAELSPAVMPGWQNKNETPEDEELVELPVPSHDEAVVEPTS